MMKKKLSIEDIEKSVTALDSEEAKSVDTVKTAGKDKAGKTEVSFSKKKKKRRIRRYVILTIVVLLLAGLGWVGWISYNSIKNIFAGGDAPNLLGLFDNRQLKGEASGRVNILLLGVGDEGHSGQTLSDTIMVMSLDTRSNKMAMLSIPRDLYVKIPHDCGYNKINYAHACGELNNRKQGPQYATDTISGILDIPIHYYVRVDFTGFKEIIDKVGGVDINVEKDLYDPYYPGGTVSIKKGKQHMNGSTALKYARSRETTSDFDRAKRQQQVISAVKDKLMSSSTLLNPKKLIDILSIVGNHMKTNFQTNEFQRLIELGKKIDSSKTVNRVIDNGANGPLVSGNYSGYTLIPRLGLDKYDELESIAKNIFSENTIKTENARISVLNGTTRAGLAQTLADRLSGQNYNVVYYGTGTNQYVTATVIKDYSNGAKSQTTAALSKLLNAPVQKVTGSSNYDIEIIIGKDYQG
jgi:LCP family protein required for cell wall assembly